MQNDLKSRFLFTVCQAGAEAALKKEIGRNHPGLRFAFSRPGFVTFKCAEEGAELDQGFSLNSVFSRAYGLSLGKTDKTLSSDTAKAEQILERARKWITPGDKLRLHVFERDQFPPTEEPKDFVQGARARVALHAIQEADRAAKVQLFLPESQAKPGDRVLDVIVVEPEEWWIGAHLHTSHSEHSPFPGGRPDIQIPAHTPSRAYLKLEEGLLWSGAPLRPGDVAVEIGSAPGGACDALLQRGLKVVGIDPADMDRRILGNPNFRHIQRPVAMVPREELPESIQWLLLDMNVTPHVSLYAVDRLGSRMKESLLGVLLTVKLNEWKLADEIPSMLDHIKAMGMARVRATQLANNRQEIFIYGLARKGMARLPRSKSGRADSPAS